MALIGIFLLIRVCLGHGKKNSVTIGRGLHVGNELECKQVIGCDKTFGGLGDSSRALEQGVVLIDYYRIGLFGLITNFAVFLSSCAFCGENAPNCLF